MKKLLGIVVPGLLWSNISVAEEKKISFINKEEVVNSYQAQAISFSPRSVV